MLRECVCRVPDAVGLANARVKASWPGSLQRVHASIDAYRSLAEHLCFTGDDRALGALETFAERVQVSVTLAVTWLALAQTLEDGPGVLREARVVAGEDSGTD